MIAVHSSRRRPARLAEATRAAAILVPVALGLLAGLAPARADDGDPAGWSVLTDPRRRAFLVATETAGGPRRLTIACLRDVDTVTVYAAPSGLAAGRAAVDLRLSVADAGLDLTGAADEDDGRVVLTAEAADGVAARRALEKPLMRLLSAPGPLVVAVDGAEPFDLPLEDLPPRRGIAGPLKTFARVCFGK